VLLGCSVQDKTTGDLVTDHRAIARRYLSGWFAVDLLATFPVDYIVRAVEVRVVCAVTSAAGLSA
jgi:hypothetical protein